MIVCAGSTEMYARAGYLPGSFLNRSNALSSMTSTNPDAENCRLLASAA